MKKEKFSCYKQMMLMREFGKIYAAILKIADYRKHGRCYLQEMNVWKNASLSNTKQQQIEPHFLER